MNVRRVAAASLSAGFVAVLAMSLAPPAHAAVSKKLFFEYGVDKSSWYWTRQQDIPIGDVEGSPVTQRQRVPHRQQANTLPVAVTDGGFEKISAIYWDLQSRGVTPGSIVSKFLLQMQEVSSSSEYPAFGFPDKKISACRIDDFWPAGEGEVWDTQPAYGGKAQEGEPPVSKPPFAQGACVDGTRDDTKAPALWTFDLTLIAQTWGEDPLKNNGVMLVGELRDTWQNNLKIPARDCPDCLPPTEYEPTKEFATAQLEFTPGAPEAPSLPPAAVGGIDTGGFAPPPGTTFEPPPAPSSVGEEPVVTAPPGTQPVAAAELGPIEMQGIVWLLVPLGLLAFAAARSVVVEPAAATRRGGVIESIRQRNAERRGVGVADEEAAPFEAVTGALARIFRRGTR